MHTLFYSNISEFAGNLEGILDEGTYKTTIQNMYKLFRKAQLFKSADVLMLGHGCGVSQYPQFYDRIKNIYQMLPRPYVGSYSGEKGHQFLNKLWILALAKSVERFLCFNKWHANYKILSNFGKKLDKARENIPKQYIIGDACFKSLATIGGNSFTKHTNNLNHVHKCSNYLLSVIIILETDVRGGKPVF